MGRGNINESMNNDQWNSSERNLNESMNIDRDKPGKSEQI